MPCSSEYLPRNTLHRTGFRIHNVNINLGQAKNKKLDCLWPKMAVLYPPFDPKIRTDKVYEGPLLRSFPANEAHKLFSWGPNWGVLGGGQKFMLKTFLSFFFPLYICQIVLP